MRKSQQLTPAARDHVLQTALASCAMAHEMLRVLCDDVDRNRKQTTDEILAAATRKVVAI